MKAPGARVATGQLTVLVPVMRSSWTPTFVSVTLPVLVTT